MKISKTVTPIRVKLIARGHSSYAWREQTPGCSGRWGDCQFLFDREERNYDWLVVIDDISRKLAAPPEILACPDTNTLLVTTEPSPITHYGKGFASQFEWVLTSQSPQALIHPRRLHSTTGNLWFHGKSYDELFGNDALEKTQTLSTVCSSKQQKHTMHHARYEFTQWLKQRFPAMEIYGHGVRFVEKKYEAMDAYKYHLAIENYVAPHHWTEKFSDPLLSHCVPIYHGCPNLSDYFPDGSYIPIDIGKKEDALEIILNEVSDPDTYASRREAMLEARRLVLKRYNMLALLNEHISAHCEPSALPSRRPIFGRKQMRLRNPRDLASNLIWQGQRMLKKLSGSID